MTPRGAHRDGVAPDPGRSSPVPGLPTPRVRLMIVGTPRSGTTLVQRLAIEATGLASSPETHFYSRFPPLLSREQGIFRAPGRAALVRALRAYSEIDLLRGTNLSVDDVVAVLAGRVVDVDDVFEAVTYVLSGGALELCEKTPGHLWWWGHLARARPELRFAVVVRDPRGAVASMADAGFGAHTLAGYVEWWRHDQTIARAAVAALGKRCLLLRYEDVVRDEHEARARLAALCRVSVGGDGPAPTTSGIVLPWETWKRGSEGPISADRVESWRDRLSPDDADYVESVTAKQMRDFGYATHTHHRAITESPRRRLERASRRLLLTAYRARQPRLLRARIDLRDQSAV